MTILLNRKWRFPVLIFLLIADQVKAQNQPLSLKECIHYTLQHHPSSTIYKYSALAAAEKIRESKAAFLPSVSGTIGMDYNIKLQTTVLPAGSFAQTETRLQMGNKFSNYAYVQADQNLFDRSSSLNIKASRVNKEISDLNVLKQNETLIYNTASAYYQALTYSEKNKLLQENKAQYESTITILKLRYEQGVIKKSEFDRARVNYNNVLSEIQANNSAYQLAVNTLKNNMGLELDASISIQDSMTDTTIDDPAAKSTDLQLSNVIDYKIDEKTLELKRLEVQQKKAAFIPTLSIYGKYGGNAYGSELTPALTNWFDYSAVGIKATIPIFSGFKRKSQLTQSEFNFKSQELTNKLNQQTYKLNVENASNQTVSSYSVLKQAKETLQLAKEMMATSTLEYKEGTTTLSSLIDAEYSYKESQTNYSTALLEYLTAQLSYYKSSGTITQFMNILK